MCYAAVLLLYETPLSQNNGVNETPYIIIQDGGAREIWKRMLGILNLHKHFFWKYIWQIWIQGLFSRI